MIIKNKYGVYLKEQIEEGVYSYEWTCPTQFKLEFFNEYFNSDKSLIILNQIKESNQKLIDLLQGINCEIDMELNNRL